MKVADINNGGNYSSPMPHVVDFSSYSGTGRHIAFRNMRTTSGSVSYNWIDDIYLYEEDDDACGISLTYEQGFETGDPSLDCWSFIPESSTTTAPKLSTSNTNSGSYCYYMTGRGFLVLPEHNADLTKSLSMSFYYKQKKYAHRLEIGVMSDPEDAGTYEKVAVITNEGNYSTPVYHEVSFANYQSDGKHIVFRNVTTNSNTVSYNWIDDIKIFVTGSRAAAADNSNGYDVDDYNLDYDYDADLALEPTGIDGFDISDFTVYPNPTTGMLTLGTEAQRVEMLSLTGQRVALFENASSVDISNLPSGVYILKATLPQGTAVRKVLRC